MVTERPLNTFYSQNVNVSNNDGKISMLDRIREAKKNNDLIEQQKEKIEEELTLESTDILNPKSQEPSILQVKPTESRNNTITFQSNTLTGSLSGANSFTNMKSDVSITSSKSLKNLRTKDG